MCYIFIWLFWSPCDRDLMEGLGAAAGGCSAVPEDTDSVITGSGIDAADLGMQCGGSFTFMLAFHWRLAAMRASCASITCQLLHGLIWSHFGSSWQNNMLIEQCHGVFIWYNHLNNKVSYCHSALSGKLVRLLIFCLFPYKLHCCNNISSRLYGLWLWLSVHCFNNIPNTWFMNMT